jgi:ribosomal protein L11 methylase PrmA
LNLIFEKGSYKDPAGQVFYYNDSVYRALTKEGVKRFNEIKNKGIIDESISKKFLIDTKVIDSEYFSEHLNKYYLFLEHKKINFVSYPYEWCFEQLKQAALHHLNFQIFLLERDCVLIDASAYNIQFNNTKPIFIDVLSIENYKYGSYWFGHKQFCEQFLNPLLISSAKNINFNNWFKGNLDGISTSDTNSILSFKDKINPSVFTHVFLLDRLQKKTIENPKETIRKLNKKKNISKETYKYLLLNLKNFITKLKISNNKSLWQNYSINNTYSFQEESLKKKIIANFSQKNKFNCLVDLGCNNGTYSFLSLESGSKNVIGFDYDLNALNDSFIKAKKNSSNFLPLYMDVSNPSANLGWDENERKNISSRAKFDGMIALALIHHLCIAKNIPLENAINWLVSFAPKGIIEFVPKNDETIIKMLQLREDIFSDYTAENFENILKKKTKIIEKKIISSSGRTLYEYQAI